MLKITRTDDGHIWLSFGPVTNNELHEARAMLDLEVGTRFFEGSVIRKVLEAHVGSEFFPRCTATRGGFRCVREPHAEGRHTALDRNGHVMSAWFGT